MGVRVPPPAEFSVVPGSWTLTTARVVAHGSHQGEIRVRYVPIALLIGALGASTGCGSAPTARSQMAASQSPARGGESYDARPPGPLHPDRPITDPVRRFVEAAGFGIAGDTGSAWIAKGKGASFYIWASDVAPEAILSAGTWRLAFRDSETSLYAVEDQEVWWSAGEHVIIMRRVLAATRDCLLSSA